MEIRSAKFVKGVIGSEGLPDPPRPTIAFFGRSNVGKSSLINSLTRVKNLARANAHPGRTTEINFFLLNDRWYLADLPGYGYAKVAPKQRDKIAGYLSWFAADQSIDIIHAVLIIDAEVGIKDSDRETLALLQEYGRPVIVVANKIDKVKRSELGNQMKKIEAELDPIRVIRSSTKTGEGRGELLSLLFQ